MPAFRTALDRLAALAVTGIRHNYGLDALPETLARVQLPALLVQLEAAPDDRLFRERGRAFERIAFSGGQKTVRCAVTHLLLAAPVAAGLGAKTALPPLADLIDAYFAALAAAPTLDGALAEAFEVGIEPGVFAYGGTDYHGCAFRHRWVIAL